MSESIQKTTHESCSKCSNGKMIHSELYVWECDICEFKYRINPASKKKDTIEILQKSVFEVGK